MRDIDLERMLCFIIIQVLFSSGNLHRDRCSMTTKSYFLSFVGERERCNLYVVISDTFILDKNTIDASFKKSLRYFL